jgi:hypothetical protein
VQQAENFGHDVGPRFRELGPDHHHVIDRNAAVLLRPPLRRGFAIRNQMLQARVRQLVAHHRRVDFAVQQHLDEVLAGRRALDGRRIAILGDVGILEGDPLARPPN